VDNAIARYLPRIRALQPDLAIEQVTYNGEGLVNDVLVVNSALVYRFARDKRGMAILAQELRILDLVRPQVSLQVPTPFHVGGDLVAYRLIPGETLSWPLLTSLSEGERARVAGQLADFVQALHSIPVDEDMPPTAAPATYARWAKIRREVEAQVYPLLMRHQIEWAEQLFDGVLGDPDGFDYPPRLSHGDLGPYHILFDREAGQIKGIIDFGVAGVGDPATDLGNLIQVYGESFVAQIVAAYPAAEAWMPRARFYAQAIELQWALSGLTSGESFWFMAHLGGARDICP
jgi:aminoglycoside 2''-phosphotransferase